MTIGAWVGLGFIALTGLGIAAIPLVYYISERKLRKNPVWALIVSIVLVVGTVAICWVFIWYRGNSESGKRALKDQQSNLNGGIERVVSVYDIDGELIEQYTGKFDIETDRNSYILFDDEDGNRHIVYYTTGTIIVDEKTE